MNLAIAYLLALPIGWNREREERRAGLPTFPPMAMASCSFVSVAIAVLRNSSPGQSCNLEGLMAGVGFIGGGAILKQGTHATGTASAASVWATGALGGAVGYGLYNVAAILSVCMYLTPRFVSPLKRAAHNGSPTSDK